MIRSLLRDTRGSAAVNLLSYSPTWFVVFGVFLMNVQLGRTYGQRDAVDHAAAVGADTAMKTYCETPHGSSAAASAAVMTSIQASLDLAGGHEHCEVAVKEASTQASSESGARALQVDVACRFPCTIPIAAPIMCTGGIMALEAHQTSVAMGCDGK